MSPRAWKITVDGRTVTVVAGTREAAEKRAARRAKRPQLLANPHALKR